MTDPVRVRRAKVARYTVLGKQLGYSAFGLSIVLFVLGFGRGFNGGLVNVIVALLIIGSALLAPTIVLGYAVKAAEREDRELGR